MHEGLVSHTVAQRDFAFGKLDVFCDADLSQALFARPLELILLPQLDGSCGGGDYYPREDTEFFRIDGIDCDLQMISFSRCRAGEMNAYVSNDPMLPCVEWEGEAGNKTLAFR